jgi:hypothetical protein
VTGDWLAGRFGLPGLGRVDEHVGLQRKTFGQPAVDLVGDEDAERREQRPEVPLLAVAERVGPIGRGGIKPPGR